MPRIRTQPTGVTTGEVRFVTPKGCPQSKNPEVQVLTDELELEWWPGHEVFSLIQPKRWGK